MRELRRPREALTQALATRQKPAPVPPYLFKSSVVKRFRERLSAAFLAGDRDLARAYLDRLVERIVLTDGDVVVEAKASAGVGVMAESAKNPRLSPTAAEGRPHGLGWYARGDSNPRPAA